MRVAVRALLVAVATAGAAAEVWAVHQGWSWVSAALDLLAGWSLMAAAGWAVHVTAGCRMLLGLSGAFWFLATPQVVGGPVGLTAILLGAVWLAPLATALLGAPDAAPTRPFSRAAAIAVWVRALPALAGIGWLTAATSGLLATAALLDSGRYAVRAPRAAAVVVGVLLCAAGMLQAVAGRGSALEPLVAVSVAGCGIAMLTVRSARVATDSGFAGLVVELSETRDAPSLERRLARAVGDPRLRLLYQLAPGLPFVTVSGLPAGITPAGRVVTAMGQTGPVVAALEHDRVSLEDPQLREAVLAVGRLAVRRLMRASEAARQSIDLAESRRRLVQAEEVVRQQFASDVTGGPGRSLAECIATLDEALAVTPASLRADVAAARAAGQAAQEELAQISAGAADRMLARGGLASALLDLARSAGAEASVRIDGDIAGDVAAAAWFAASEAVTNALKHAGPARIWLSAVTEETCLRVRVTDDGVGGADPGGRGLRGLSVRLAEHGGRLQVLGGERGGTIVAAEIPLDDSQRGAGSRVACVTREPANSAPVRQLDGRRRSAGPAQD
jgi:signal transduction histidine kinase